MGCGGSKAVRGPLMLAGHNDGRDLAVGSFLGDASNGGGWMEQLHGGRGRFVYVSSSPSNKREYAFSHKSGMPNNCYRIESTDRKGLTVQPFHEQQSINQGRAKPRSEGDNTSFVCVWDHQPEKSTWEFERHAGGGFLLKLKVHGWAQCHGRSIDVYENKGYLAVANDHKLDVRDSNSYYVHITNQIAGAAIWKQPALEARVRGFRDGDTVLLQCQTGHWSGSAKNWLGFDGSNNMRCGSNSREQALPLTLHAVDAEDWDDFVQDAKCAERIVEEIKSIMRTDHFFYRLELRTASRMLSEAMSAHGDDYEAILEALKRNVGADHYMYRMDKGSAIELLRRTKEQVRLAFQNTYTIESEGGWLGREGIQMMANQPRERAARVHFDMKRFEQTGWVKLLCFDNNSIISHRNDGGWMVATYPVGQGDVDYYMVVTGSLSTEAGLRRRLERNRARVRETEARLAEAPARLVADRKRLAEDYRKRTEADRETLEAARKRVQEVEARLAALLATQAEQEPAMREAPVERPGFTRKLSSFLFGEQEPVAESEP